MKLESNGEEMHSYLKSIGFSNILNKKEMEKLIQTVIDNPTITKKYHIDKNMTLAELSIEISENIGITVFGEYDIDNKFHIDHYFPYFKSKNVSLKEEIFINKKIDTDSYTIMCDDYRLGVSLIFFLQNTINYIENKKNYKHPNACSVILSALALDGKILMPVEKTEKQIKISKASVNHRSQLIAEAKKGNQEAIDSLTIDDIDLYSTVSKRIQNEDVYSIVETSFYPYGSESDSYTVLGNIKECCKRINSFTKEEMYTLLVECNQIEFEICINKKDLLGEPVAGRRFKGNVWMQGSVEFD